MKIDRRFPPTWSAAHDRLYWREWRAVLKANPRADRSFLTAQALGQDKWEGDFSDIEFGKVLEAFREISQPQDLITILEASERRQVHLARVVLRLAARTGIAVGDISRLPEGELDALRMRPEPATKHARGGRMSNPTLPPPTASVVRESSSTKFLVADAMPIARKFVAFLEKHCTRVMIAGSLRRQKQLVSDIEILFISRVTRVKDPQDLFGDGAAVELSAANLAIDALLDSGLIVKRPNKNGYFTWGPENKLAIHVASGIPVDFFATTEEKWWNALVVRTGPKELNKRIAGAALRMGWEWHAYGSGFTRGEGKSSIDRVIAKSEHDVFHHVGLPYQEPKDR
jgi:DNA polymerase beta thumb